MHDIVLDTHVLSDFLAQYFEQWKEKKHFNVSLVEPTKFLRMPVVREMQKIIRMYDDQGVHRIVASTVAFLEIARKFQEIAENRFQLEQFSGFIDQPPEWFVVAPVDDSLFLPLLQIPAYVTMPDGQSKAIEWIDAIHLATALSREKCLFATMDSRLKRLPDFQDNII